jgi:hypothetical protein
VTASDEATTNLTVRALPARVRARLAARAKARRQSLNAYLLDLLSREADTPTMDEVLAGMDRRCQPSAPCGKLPRMPIRREVVTEQQRTASGNCATT